MKKIAAFLVLSLVLMSGDLLAQTGLLQGTVSRETGARLSNARLTVTDAAGKVVVQGVSGPTGQFSLSVPLGEFDITINAGGFGHLRQRVRIAPGVLHLAFTLVQLPDGIDLRGNPLQSNANGNAIVLDEEFLSMLSDDHSEFAISLAGTGAVGPGATQSSLPGSSGRSIGGVLGGFAAGGGGFNGPGGGFPGASPIFPLGATTLGPFTLAGQPRLAGPRVNLTGAEYIVDGLSGRLPPRDLVREVWIDSDPFTAEYSRPGFGRLHAQTLFAPREFHGSTAFNFRDESMDPQLFSSFRSRYQTRYFHGEAGGPLIRERLFATLAAERASQYTGRSFVAAVTPDGPVNKTIDNGNANQAFDGRSQYQISDRHQLHVNSRYRTQVFRFQGGATNLPEQGSSTTYRGWDLQGREVSRLGTNVVHEIRFQVRRDTSNSVPAKEGTTLYVFGAFAGGGTSYRSAYHDTQYQFENLLAWSTPQWTLRMGAQGYRFGQDFRSQGDVLGTFYFSNLNDYRAGTPFLYTRSLSPTNYGFRQTEVSAFAQGEWNATPQFSLSGGLRYEVQTNLRDRNNLDPRIALAYQVRPGMTLRLGAGVFHQRFRSEDSRTLASADGAIRPTSLSISNPSYPSVPSTGGDVTYGRNTLALRDPDLAAPYLAISSLSLDKWFDSGLMVSASVDVIRGMRQIRVRNINAPVLDGVASPELLTRAELDQRRPYHPLTQAINQYESVGSLKAKNLSLRVRTHELRVWKVGMRLQGDYTLGWSEDDAGVPFDPYNRRAEWGRSSLYPRHNFWTGAVTRAPWGVSLAALVHAHSGFPYSVLVSDEGKNTIDGLNYFNLDLKLAKTLILPRRVEATLFAYGQNVFNSRNYNLQSTFQGAGSIRRMELGVRLRF